MLIQGGITLKKLIVLTGFTLMLSTGLVACGTGANKDEVNAPTINQNDKKNEQTSTSSKDGTEGKTTESKDSTTDSNNDNTAKGDSSSNSSAEPRTSEKEMTYESDGKSVTEVATLSEKSPQGYSMYVLPSYSFTGEEPGKDIVFDKEDGHNFMRIEVYPSSSTNLDDLKHSAEQQLKALNNQVDTISDEEAPQQWEKTVILKAEKDNDLVQTYLFKQKDHFVKLTMFTKIDDNRLKPFLQMASTIQF